jgi:hypothetical protein
VIYQNRIVVVVVVVDDENVVTFSLVPITTLKRLCADRDPAAAWAHFHTWDWNAVYSLNYTSLYFTSACFEIVVLNIKPFCRWINWYSKRCYGISKTFRKNTKCIDCWISICKDVSINF